MFKPEFKCKPDLYDGGFSNAWDHGTFFTTQTVNRTNDFLSFKSRRSTKPWIIGQNFLEDGGYVKYSWKSKNIRGAKSAAGHIYFGVYGQLSRDGDGYWDKIIRVEAPSNIRSDGVKYFFLQEGSFLIPIKYKQTYIWIGFGWEQTHFFADQDKCDEPFTITFEYVSG